MKDENAHMLADDVYDAFVLVPLYLAMYLKEDLHIHGNMSKRLYKNITNYLQRILCDFSPDLSRVNVIADGFAEAHGEQNIIGAGISCGVDSLTTIYDRYVHESDPDYRVNGLFLFNCGTHGDFGEKSSELWRARYNLNKRCADELGLPVYQVDSNFHAFTHIVGSDTKAGYIAIYSCILGVQGAVKKYYVSSTYSYQQVITIGAKAHDKDFSEFAETYTVPLLRTETIELVLDGSQYERSQKTEHIADWEIVQKYLNVCVPQANNCSKCVKCLRTLIALDALGKLDDFSSVFDLDTYRRYSFRNKCNIVIHRNKDGMMNDNYNFARSHGMKFPSYPVAWLYLLPSLMAALAKKALRKIIGPNSYEALKNRMKHHHSS